MFRISVEIPPYTDEKDAREAVEAIYRGLVAIAQPVVTIAIMEDRKMVDCFHGDKWSSDSPDDGFEITAPPIWWKVSKEAFDLAKTMGFQVRETAGNPEVYCEEIQYSLLHYRSNSEVDVKPLSVVGEISRTAGDS